MNEQLRFAAAMQVMDRQTNEPRTVRVMGVFVAAGGMSDDVAAQVRAHLSQAFEAAGPGYVGSMADLPSQGPALAEFVGRQLAGSLAALGVAGQIAELQLMM